MHEAVALHACQGLTVLTLEPHVATKGALMPLWEEHAAVACAVQNFHLQLCAEGYSGYWCSLALTHGLTHSHSSHP